MTRRQRTSALAIAAWCLVATAACQSAVEPADSEPPTFSVSHWTEATELFMEHPPLVAGTTARMAVHLTTLNDFRPLDEGRPAIELRASDGRVTMLPGSPPLRPGAFRVEGVLPAAGEYTWGLRVQAARANDFHDLGRITVFPTIEAALSAPAPPEGAPAIGYLKEQQWSAEFATAVARAEPMRRSLRAPATITPPAGGEAVMAAPAAGRLVTMRLPQVGDVVSAGALLARFEPRLAAVEDRALLVQQVTEARVAVEAAEVAEQRAQRLLAERAVPARRLEDARRELLVTKAQLEAAETRLAQRDQTLRSGGAAAGDNAFDLRAPIAGTIVTVAATPGAAYEEGSELFRIVRTDRVAIEVQVPPSAGDIRAQVTDVALDIPGYDRPVQARILRQSHAGIVDPKLRALLLRFEVSNADAGLLVGQAATAVLYLRDQVTVPVVPATAILSEAGRPFVFLQVGGESFERRAVELGAREDGRVAVMAGLEPGERVVVRGTYDVQLASAAKGLPAEGHVH